MKQIIIIFMILTKFYLLSCTKLVNPTNELFKIMVDSIQAPVSIGHTDTLSIKFWGLIGTDGCYSLSHFETKQTTDKISITVWGKHRKDNICPTVMVYLNGYEYKFYPPYNSDSIKIIVYRPNDSTITKTVRINYPSPTIFGQWS